MTQFDTLRDRRKIYNTVKSDAERAIEFSGEFPNCRGLYPDCPEIPSLENPKCKICPKTDNSKK